MLNLLGWIDGLTASGVVIFGILFGTLFIFLSRRSNAKILFYLGLANAFAGLMFLGVFLDFIVVILTDNNITNTYGIVGILSYIWMAPAVITSIYIGTELLLPSKKWYWVIIFIILSIVFEFFIFLDPLGTFDFSYPANQLIDYNVNTFSMAGFLMAIFLLSIIILLGLGFIIKSLKSSGVIRKKFFLIGMGAISFCIFGLIEGLFAPGIFVILVRIGYLTSFWLMYYGLRD
jgi:hypothetical protein